MRQEVIVFRLQIKTPTLSESLTDLNVLQLCGGSKSLFAVTRSGEEYACGVSTNGRLGVNAVSGNVTVPRLLDTLSGVHVKKLAVHSGGRHCLAITTLGKLYSWGEGEDGKLGHGNRQ